MRKKPFVGQFGAKNVIPPPQDRTHEERVSEFCTPDDEERKMKTRLKFDEFFSRLKLLILYPKWAILCASSSSFLPLFFEKKITSSIANLVMTNSRKNNFFLKLLSDELLNLYPHWSTESTWHDSTGLFWGCWYCTHNDISTKKNPLKLFCSHVVYYGFLISWFAA